MKAFLSRPELFERDIVHFPQDVIQNSVWQHIYGHVSTSIGQDNNLGTDLNWLPDIPEPYAPWFQNILLPRYDAMMQPFIRSNWWRRSWFGSRYVLALDHCIIDDGRIRLKGLWVVDTVIMIGIMLAHTPPFGYFALLRDFLQRFGPSIVRRLKLGK